MSDWVEAIDAIHARGMYIMLDFTVGTMADMSGWLPYVATLALKIQSCQADVVK